MNTGPEPSGGFSLIEFALVLSMAIILLATVDSWLEEYRVRGHVAEALAAAETAKANIVTSCAANGAIKELTNEVIAHTFPYSPYVETITVTGTCDEPQIIVQTTNTGLFVEPMLVISGEYSGSNVRWFCNSTGFQIDIPNRCRGIQTG